MKTLHENNEIRGISLWHYFMNIKSTLKLIVVTIFVKSTMRYDDHLIHLSHAFFTFILLMSLLRSFSIYHQSFLANWCFIFQYRFEGTSSRLGQSLIYFLRIDFPIIFYNIYFNILICKNLKNWFTSCFISLIDIFK